VISTGLTRGKGVSQLEVTTAKAMIRVFV